ncbi:hypothetical protein BIW11_09767 [Tropilaelaps mercedesae]|uniref:Uncharacterized protein n=1 Tax=Tropilaelaps mercedesae TaxID=418985 RepID=A0A1V9XIM4_9ACAR|nr:hypothetical protein BIW11_09767 [Tropilaelaps mercedesae]
MALSLGVLLFLATFPFVLCSPLITVFQPDSTEPYRVCGSHMIDILEIKCRDYGGIAKRSGTRLRRSGISDYWWTLTSDTTSLDSPGFARLRRQSYLREACRVDPEDNLLCVCCPKYNRRGCTTKQLLRFCASQTKVPRRW